MVRYGDETAEVKTIHLYTVEHLNSFIARN